MLAGLQPSPPDSFLRQNRAIDCAYLIVHGLGGSGPDHWQTWLAGALRERGLAVSYPDLPAPDVPSLGPWCEALEAKLGGPELPVVLCHSLGAVTWLHLAARLRRPLARRVLLVAPPSAGSRVREIAGFVPPPLDPEALAAAAPATRLVCAPSGDPYCPEGAGGLYGEPLGIPVDALPGAGHINTDAGYGPWPAVEAWCLDGSAVPIAPR
jgi:predicted alpha/beta hydrolase family esterase